MTKLSWTQPICDDCWKRPPIRDTHGPEDPTRLLNPEKERCAFCGEDTTSGIYVRHDPRDARYPTTKGN